MTLRAYLLMPRGGVGGGGGNKACSSEMFKSEIARKMQDVGSITFFGNIKAYLIRFLVDYLNV